MTRRRYKPMLAQSADAPFDSEDWIFEVKWDGVRAMSYMGGEVSVRSRNDLELIGRFPELAELGGLIGSAVLDGEIVVMSGGKPQIQALLSRVQKNDREEIAGLARQSPATYIVFDILEKDGVPLIDLTLRDRRKILTLSLKEGAYVALSVPVEEKGRDYYKVVTDAGLEGIMAKRMDSVYEPGQRSGSWLKIKELHTCDCVIFGFTRGTGARAGTFGALILGLYQQGLPVYVGKVGTGFSDSLLRSLLEEFKALISPERTIGGVPENNGITWLRPALVIEVAYQSVTRDRRLRMPRFVRVRPDKTPEECTSVQLVAFHPGQKEAGEKIIAGTPEMSKASTEKRAGKSLETEEEGEIRERDDGTDTTGLRDETGKDELKKSRVGNGRKGGEKFMKREENAGSPPGQEELLKEYHEKRDFSATTEPAGETTAHERGDRFVIQEHHASHLHYDLRLERDGVLKSWAVPKGIPAHPGERHLAIEVEDHPLEYGSFEGEIPKGQYGAGTVSIWDSGTYETIKWVPEKIELVMHGRRLEGKLALIRFRKAGTGEWLLIRGKD